MCVIPAFDSYGNLPPGIYVAEWDEIEQRFGLNEHRRKLLAGLAEALLQFRLAGCRRFYLDGSFVTAEPFPVDYDACYDPRGMDPLYLDPVFFDMRAGRSTQKAKYGGEFFPSSMIAAASYSFLEFFQVDKNTAQKKGIVAIAFRGVP